MAKKKENPIESDVNTSEFFNAHLGKNVKLADPSHAIPQAETEAPKRPEVKDPKHLKPQE